MTRTCPAHGVTFEVDGYKPLDLRDARGVTVFHGYADCSKCQEVYSQRSFSVGMRDANIPTRFAGKDFGSFEASTTGQKRALKMASDYAERFDQHRAAGRCLVFSGKVGTGKTLLACAITATLIRAGYKPYYTTAAELIRWIRSAWRKDSDEDDGKILRRIQEFDLLILDEIGMSFGSDAEVQQLTEVLDLRYRETRPTLVVSNYSLSDMGKYVGERGLDRLKDNGGQVAIFDWESHRGRGTGLSPLGCTSPTGDGARQG